ncbi:MAG TPA: single-stranded-DNA-specific exonuclease RecJ [Polyangiaceae bacterium]|nr:single-stranded-DNA-specific exonuclease RecJ [Polyangiaceae bacterium]
MESARATELELSLQPSFEGFPAPASLRAQALSRALGVSVTFASWLDRLGHAEAEATRRFLNPRLAELTSPDAMLDRKVAAQRIARAVKERQRIVVFGDYDCDGMTSAAIFTEALRALGGQITPVLASRFEGGYGLSQAALERVLGHQPQLLVTCDCGSSDHASLQQLGPRGVDVVVVDHHLVPDQPLPALAFLNPHRPGCGFPYKGLASCGLALSVLAAVRAELGQALDLRPLLDLVAIGTIADVAPLDRDNRALVRAGLKVLGEARRPGVRALLELADIEPGQPLRAEDVAFRIAPRLNAPGRLGAPDLAVELLLATSLDTARALAAEIEQRQLERRAVQQRILEEALAEVEREGYRERAAVVLGREGWNHGIVGIVAGRLASELRKPVVVIGFENGVGRGSVRGPQGARLHDAVSACSSLLRRFGGHQAAAGLEVESEKLEALRSAFESACAAQLPATCSSDEQPCARLARGDSLARVYAELGQLEPCGESNPTPALALVGRVVSAREVTGGHLKLELALDSGERLSAFGIAMGARAESLSGEVAVSGRLRPDRYRGGGAIELKLDKIW